MKIKDLKLMIADLPDDMEMAIIDGWTVQSEAGYEDTAHKAFNGKTKLVKKIKGRLHVQIRPFNDPDAELMFLIL